MTPPAELLERALVAHGDTLYRLALLIGGGEGPAEALLRALVAERAAAWRQAPPAAPPPEPELLAGLVAAARAAEAAAAQRKAPRARPTLAFGPFAIASLPLDQRLALGLFMLLGYDPPRIAAVVGIDEAAARAALTAAVRALGPAAGHALTDRVSGDLCLPVRAAMLDPSAGARHGSAVRGHLATCALCRSYDQAWAEILSAVEAQLRAALRERALPPALAARLVAMAQPARRRLSPTLRVALPPLAVLALIAALVLPGFLQAPVSVVQHGDSAPVNPQQLLARALERHAAPPERGAVWYGRYETQWFFGEGVYAPLTAEVWLDPRNPARHRLQLTHADGGAPYELQLGNGRDRLYYALDYSYAPAIYGSLTTQARPEEPALVAERLDPEAQRRARDERLASGPWAIGPDYLRQAQAAADLRVLGRQRDRGRTVQILSFSGVSPLGLPPDAPGATAERVTVLLAIDTEDGLLRSATELSGPAGAEQVSRVTWRLTEELWLASGAQIEPAFDIGRAWTGMGEFSERGRHESADPALPLISRRAIGDPARLLSGTLGPIWMPSAPPAGVDRALLLWSEGEAGNGAPPQGLVYLGAGRRLVIVFNRSRRYEGETVRRGDWSGALRPGPTHRYHLSLSRPPASSSLNVLDPSANLLIDAYGFTRDELLAVIESLRPFDLAALAAQDTLFAGRAGSPEARAALLKVALESSTPPEGRASYLRARQFTRQSSPAPLERSDPYISLPYMGRPPVIIVEEWAAARGGPVRYIVTSSGAGTPYARNYYDGAEAWHYEERAESAYRFSTRFLPAADRLPYPAGVALELLWANADDLTMERLPGGGTLLSSSEQTEGSPRYGYLLNIQAGGTPHIADLRPLTMTTELQLTSAGEPEAVRVYADRSGRRRDLVVSYEVLERAEMPIAAAPAPLSDGALPAALSVIDYRGSGPGRGASTTSSLVTRPLDEARDSDELYQFDMGTLLFVEEGPSDASYQNGGDVVTWAVGQRLAQRLTYLMPQAGGDDVYIRLTQGPAGPLSAFLRLVGLPWSASAPAQLTVAGRPAEGWLGQGETGFIVVELDGTLIILDGPQGWIDRDGAAALAGLRLAGGP